MENKIVELRKFNYSRDNAAIISSGYNEDLSSEYALINNNLYNFSDLREIVGEIPNGEGGFEIDSIKQHHLGRFEEERDKGFYSIPQN